MRGTDPRPHAGTTGHGLRRGPRSPTFGDLIHEGQSPSGPDSGQSLSSLERAAQDYPSLYPFGIAIDHFLNAAEERAAPFQDRLRSSWRYIVRRVKRFGLTLSPREAAVLDVEDVIHEIVCQLIAKDHVWDPDRGRYATFAEAIMVSVFSKCHEKARAVTGPANSYSRLKTYQRRHEEGSLTDQMYATMRAIETVMNDFSSWDDSLPRVAEDDDHNPMLPILKAVKSIDNPMHIWVLVHRYGLFGQVELTVRAMAGALDVDEEEIRQILHQTRMIVRRFLKKGDNFEAL